jgi:hypothetical protein
MQQHAGRSYPRSASGGSPGAIDARKLVPFNVIKHHRGREQQRKRIGNPPTRKIRRRAMHGLENRGVQADVGRGAIPKRVFEKSQTGAIRFSIRQIAARSIIVSEVCTRYS